MDENVLHAIECECPECLEKWKNVLKCSGEGVLPEKPITIIGIEGYETFSIDKSTIGVRPKWTSVEDSLPENMEEVLFTDRKDVYHGYIMPGYIIGETNEPDRWYTSTDFAVDKVTHWMPLPQTPEK